MDKSISVLARTAKATGTEGNYYVPIFRFAKDSGRMIGDNGYHEIKVALLSGKSRKEATFLINQFVNYNTSPSQETLTVQHREYIDFDYFIADTTNYYTFYVKPPASGWFVTAYLLNSTGENFLEGLSYRSFEFSKSDFQSFIESTKYEKPTEPVASVIKESSYPAGIHRFAEISLGVLSSAAVRLKIQETGNGTTSKFIYGEIGIKIYRGSNGNYTITFKPLAVTSDFAKSVINLHCSVTNNVLYFYKEATQTFIISLDFQFGDNTLKMNDAQTTVALPESVTSLFV